MSTDALIAELVEALAFYGEPENYHAVAFWFDPPCGEFKDDFSEDHGHPDYNRAMPGAKAREVLRKHYDVLMPILERCEETET